MSFVCIDTSALIKKYVPEMGTELVDRVFGGQYPDELLAASMLSVLEFKAVLRRLVKGKRMKPRRMTEIVSQFWKDRVKISRILPVDNALIEEAIDLVDRHALKAADAIQLASAFRLREVANTIGERLIVLTSDAELVAACEREKIDVLNPESATARETIEGLRKRP